MSRSVKVTISLPSDMLDQIERKRLERNETRSEFLRAAVEQTFRERREQGNRERYISGYQELPESDEEIAAAERLSRLALTAEPWE